jgi:hypothetical protein
MRSSGWLPVFLAACVMHCGGRSSLDDEATLAPSTADAALAKGASVSECTRCLPLACTDSFAACELDSACFTIYQCTAAGEDDCICRAPAGASPYLTLVQCIQAVACHVGECTAACAGAGSALYCPIPVEAPICSGARVDAGQGSGMATCEACAEGSCASFAAACGAGSACEEYVACLAAASPTESGDAVCASEHAGGQPLAEALDVCLGGTCEAECGF